MKKRAFALILAALLTGICSISCKTSGDESSGTSCTAYFRYIEGSPGYSVQRACADSEAVAAMANQALAELDRSDAEITLNGWYDNNEERKSDDAGWQVVYEVMLGYDVLAEDSQYSVYIRNGAALCACAKYGDYYGIFPGGLTAGSYYNELGEKPCFDDAKALAAAKYNAENTDKIS